MTRSSVLLQPGPSSRGHTSARPSSGTNAHGASNLTGGASPCSRRGHARSSSGHYFEERARRHLIEAGFKFAPPEALAFTALGGALRGHADGIIIDGPQLSGLYLIYPLLWEHKAVNSKNWKATERDGLERAFPQYAAQISLYQAYLDVTNPALFTATNADTCERLHFLVPFNAERAQMWSDRAANIIEATRAGELLPRGFDDPEDWRCRMCAHHTRCWG
jgi:hypothetical protein